MTTIISENTLNIQESTEGWTLRAYAEENFIDGDGSLILGSQIDDKGTYFAAPFDEGSTDIPAIDLPATTGSLDNKRVRYSVLAIYDRRGGQKHVLLYDFHLPASLGETTTLADLIIANRAQRVPYLPAGIYSAEQIDAKLATVALVAASEAVPLVENQLAADYPILPDSLNTKYLIEFASLGAAVSDIGSTPSILEISTAGVTGPNANLTIPANIRVRFTGKGSISIRSGRTLTIGSMEDPGSRQVFTGGGNVVLSQNIEKYNLAWWVGLGNNADAGKGLSNIITSLGSTQGEIYFPHTQAAQFTDFAINSNITFPSTSSLRFAPGARLKIGTGVTVKLPDAPNAGKHQIFSLTGTGQAVFDTLITALPQWWGAIDDASSSTSVTQIADKNIGDAFVTATDDPLAPTGTDNTTAIQAALNALNGSGGGTLDVRTNKGFIIAGGLVMDLFRYVRILGNTGMYDYAAGGRNLIFTGTPTNLISAKSVFSCYWERVGFYHTNAGFTGNMLLLGQNGNGDPGYNEVINCAFTGPSGIIPPANSGIMLETAICAKIKGCTFSNTIYGITNNSYANVIEITGSMFVYCKSYGINITPGAESWKISQNTFESSNHNGGNKTLTRALRVVGSAWSIQFDNNWLGDGYAGLITDDPMVSLDQCYGFALFNNRIANYAGSQAYGISIQQCIAGSIRDHRFDCDRGVRFVDGLYTYAVEFSNTFGGTHDFAGLKQGLYQSDGELRVFNYGVAFEAVQHGIKVGGGTNIGAISHGAGQTVGGAMDVTYLPMTENTRVFVGCNTNGNGAASVVYVDGVFPSTGFRVVNDDGENVKFWWMAIEP